MGKIKNIIKSKWSKGALVVGVVAGIVTGLGFGFKNYSSDSFNKSEDYKYKLQSSIEVERDQYSNSNINDIILDLHSALEWQGYIEADVQKISSNQILVTHELKYANNHDSLWTYEAEQGIIDEVIALQSSIFYKTDLEFRSTDGQQLFKNNGYGHPEFQKPTPPEQPETPATQDFEELFPSLNLDLIADNGAEVTLIDGNPSIILTPKTTTILNEFKKMMNELYNSYDPEANPTGNSYVTWFGYDMFSQVAKTIDPDGWAAAGQNPLTYAFSDVNGNPTTNMRPIAEPFLISIDPAVPMLDWDKNFDIGQNLNSEQAERVSSRINFSTKDYKFNLASTSLVNPAENSVQMLTMMIVFITIIAIVMFAFTWYFGLIGFINSLFTAVAALGVIGMIVAFTIPLSPFTFAVLAILIGISTIFSWNTMSKQKQILSKVDSWKEAYLKINSLSIKSNTISFVILTAITMTMGLIATMAFGLPVWLVMMTSIILYVSSTFLLPASSVLVNMMFGRARFEDNYHWILGRKPGTKSSLSQRLTLDKFATVKGARIGIVASLAIIFVGAMTFGILSATTGEGLNFNSDYSASYNYEIVMDANFTQNIETKRNDFNYLDPQNQEAFVKQLNTDRKALINVFESNGIKVESATTQKNNNYGLNTLDKPVDAPEESLNINFTYGLIIDSNSAMTLEQFTNINTQLDSFVLTALTDLDGIEMEVGGAGYSVEETYSAMNIAQGSVSIEDTTSFKILKGQVLGIVIGFAAAIILVLVFLKWTGAAAIGSTVILEGFTVFGLFPLMFLPFGSSFFIGILATVLMSMISKAIFTKEAQERITKTGKIHESVFSAVAENRRKTFWINLMVTGMIGATAIIAGGAMLPALASTLIGFALVEISNSVIFPRILSGLQGFHKNKSEQIHRADERRIRDPEVVEEEYVKGINY